MSDVLKEVLAANERYAAVFGDKAKLALPPARQFAVLTCMDARLDPAKFAGLHFTSISMQGTNAHDFPITGMTCGSTLAPNKTCGVTFHFTPSALGTRTGALTFQ